MSGEREEPPADALRRVFKIPPNVAAELVASLPRVVKRNASADQAARIVRALEEVGGKASAVQRPLAPARVLVVGEPQQEPEAERNAAPQGAPRMTAETVRLGTADLDDYGLASWLPPNPKHSPPPAPPSAPAPQASSATQSEAPAFASSAPSSHAAPSTRPAPVSSPVLTSSSMPSPPYASIPAPRIPSARVPADLSPAPAAPLELQSLLAPAIGFTPPPAPVALALAAPSASFEVTRNILDWQSAAAQPILTSASTPALELALDANPRKSRAIPAAAPVAGDPNHPMALPASLPPPAPNPQLRAPSERAQEPRSIGRRAAAQADAGNVHPLQAMQAFWQEAQKASLKRALTNHPILGFSIVLLGTTTAFLLCYALI